MARQISFQSGCSLEIGVEIIDKALSGIEQFFHGVNLPVPEIHYDYIKVSGPWVSVPTSLARFIYDEETGDLLVR